MKAFCTALFALLAFCGIATAQLGPLGGTVGLFGAQPVVSPGFTCTGGAVTTVGLTQINTFDAGGTLTCSGNGIINYLLVAGGGGGGAGTASGGGGGGAGGLLTGSQFILAGSYPVVIGTGGAPGAGCSTSTGGSISVVGGQRIHTFTSSGTFNPSGTCTVSYLVVGGGGNGGIGQNGVGSGGGGGCGGVATGSVTVSPGARTITVGGAGADSVFGGVATGSAGGAGGGAGGAGASGGCGGGGGANGSGAHAGGAGSQGGAGGTAPATSTGAGGGGGQSAAGGPGVFPQTGGAGGSGFTSSITGVSQTYACGGGGGGGSGVGGAQGCAGAGAGGSGSTANGGSATFYGHGGGGGGNGAATGAGNGFQGIVVISYPTTAGAGSGVAGTNSTVLGLTAVGGGGGGDIGVGNNGGSGGGGSSTGGATRVGGTGLAGQGNAGGAGIGASTGGGGGGGCNAIGTASSASAGGGGGGAGCSNSTSGTATTYAGGGGGWGTTAGSGGVGGGGGGCTTASCTGTAGTINTGGGGGGGSAAGGKGGSGTVLISYPVPNLVTATTTFDPVNLGPDITLSNGNLTATLVQNGSNLYEAGRVLAAQGAGKYYFECSWPSLAAPAAGAVGLANTGALNTIPGYSDANSVAVFGSLTNWELGASGTATGATTWQQGDTVGIAVDTGLQSAWQIVMHAGGISNWNASPTANPATGVGGQSIAAVIGPYYASCWSDAQTSLPIPSYTGNFGATPYQIQLNGGNIPSGFSNWPTGTVQTFTASGPSSGFVNVPSTNFTVAPVGEPTFNGSQSITISDGSKGGTITPSVGSPGVSSKTVTPTAGLSNFTFTYTPVSTPSITLAFTNGQSWPNPASLTYATSNPPTFTAIGPSTGPDTVASTNFTVTISTGTWNGSETVTISDGGQGGTITPSVGSPGTSTATVTPTNGTTAFTFTYRPAVIGAITLAFTNGQSWANPASLVYNSTAKPTYTATGPTGGTVSVASTNFTVAINAGNTWDGTQTVTISDGQAGGNRGTITPSVGSPGTGSATVTPTASTTSFTFTYTPAITGAITVAFTNGQTWANPASLVYTSTGVTTTYTVTGPSSGADLNPSTNFTATISVGSWASPDTITIADGSQGGTVTPSVGAPGTAPVTVHPVSGSTFTFTYTPAVAGAIVLSFTNGQGWGDQSPLTYNSTGGNYTATGPSGGVENVTSTNFTVTIGAGTFNGSETITVADGSQGGTFASSVGSGTSTATFTPTNLSTSFTFTYHPVVAGNITLAFTNNSALNNPTSLIYTSTAPATTYTMTGPSSGNVGVASTNFTATISTGTFNGSQTITISDGQAGANRGTITPSVGGSGTGSVTVTPANLATGFTYTYTPAIVGAITLSFTNAQAWSNPAALVYNSGAGGSIVLSAPPTGAVVSGSPTAITPVTISGGTGPYTVTIAAVTDNLVAGGSGTVTGSGTPLMTISGTGTQVNNSLATLTVAGPTTPPIAPAFASNGNQQPLTDYPTGGASFYDGVSNSTWVTWNGYNASGASMVFVRVFNHSTSTWGAPVAVAPNPLGGLNSDAGPGIVMDQFGFVHIFYGAHFSNIFYSVSTNPRNPFAWTTGNQIAYPAGQSFTYISPILINGNIWVVTTSAQTTSQDIYVIGGTPNANGAPIASFFGPSQITNFNSGFGAWAGNVVANGNLICFPFTFVASDFTHEGVFYGCYNTVLTAFQNISGSTVITSGAFPISLATAQANFTVVPWDGSSSTVIPSQAIDPNGNTHVLYSTGIGVASLLFEAFYTPAAQSPGPSLALYNSHPYYTCTNNVAVTTTGQLNTALAAAQPAGTCINLAPGAYNSASGFGISHGGTGPSKTGYVVIRCTSMPFGFSAGALTGEGSGCVLKYTGGGTDTGNVVGFNSNVSFVMFDGIEFHGNGNQANVCLDVENPGGTAGTNHHIWALNSDMHNCGQAGMQWNYTDWLFVIHNVWHDNASANGDDGSGLSFFEPAGITYTPTPGNPDYWHSNTTGNTYNIVVAYNFGYHNFNHFGGATDGEGIIIDSFNGCNNGGSGTTCPYNGNVLVMGNIMYGNGGEGIEPFSMIGPPDSPSHMDLINNTVYSNGWDGDITGTFGTGQCYSDGTIHLNWWNNLCISVTGGSAKGCDGANGTTACTVRDSDGKNPQTNNYSNNMAYPANIRSFENTPSGTYTIGGTNGNFDGVNPNLTSLVPITAASGGGSTSVSNFAPQAGSPVIGAGRAFDLWQQSGSVDIGACVRGMTNCPTSVGGTWVTGISLGGHADQSTLQPTIAPTWNGVQAWWGQSTNFPTLPDNGFTATSTTLGTWSGPVEFLAAGSSEIAMFSTVTTNQYPYGAAPFPVVFSETIQGGSNTNLRLWPFNGAAATGNDIVTYNAVDSLSNHATQQTTALKVSPWDSTVWNNPQSIASVTHSTFVSPSTNLTIGFQIYFPANYTTGSNFPVVYFLHGAGGNENEEPNDYPSVIQNELNSLIAAGTIQPMIVVFPNGGSDSKYQNAAFGAPAYSNYMGETQIMELMQYVDATFKTNPTRAGRALQGFSMGGQGCERLGLKYPQLFSSIYCVAPAIDDNSSNVVANEPALMTAMYGGTAAVNVQAFQNNTAQNIATANVSNIGGTAIHVLIGSLDALLSVNQSMDAQLTSLGIAHDVLQIASGCGHDLVCDLTTVGNGSNWIFASGKFTPPVQIQNIADDATVPAGYKITFNEEFTTLNTISTVNQSTYVPGTQWYVGNIQCCLVPNSGEGSQMYPTPDPTTGAPIYPYALDAGGGIDVFLTKLNNNWNSGVATSLASATAGVPVPSGPGAGFSQQYGYFEASMKMPPGTGTWPAFWMFPVHNTVNNGEIDIVEAYGAFQQSYCATVHDWTNSANSTGSCSGPISEYPWMNDDGYHIYSLLWTPTLLTFSIDGHFYFSTPPLPDNAQGGPYYLIFNNGICSQNGPCPSGTDPTSPQTLGVKYIRAYALTPGEGLAATFDPNPANAGFYVGMSNGNLTATVTNNIAGTAYQSARSNRSHSTGKYYFECTWSSDGGGGGSPANMVAGIFNGTSTALGISSGGVNPGIDANSAAVYGTNGWFLNSSSNGDFTSWVQGDTIGIAVDTDAKLVWQQVFHGTGGGSNWNGALNGNPATGAGGVSIASITGPYFAGCGGNPGASGSDVSVTANFGNSTYVTATEPVGGTGFGQGVPAGFKNW